MSADGADDEFVDLEHLLDGQLPPTRRRPLPAAALACALTVGAVAAAVGAFAVYLIVRLFLLACSVLSHLH